jgi:uncharacterized paraquat-inducible protein A
MCEVCAHADAHGSWPPDHHGTHCRGCHRSWPSRAQAHCLRCHEQFASPGVADLHWTKAGHVHPTTVSKLECHDEAYGPVWRTATITPSSASLGRANALAGVSS